MNKNKKKSLLPHFLTLVLALALLGPTSGKAHNNLPNDSVNTVSEDKIILSETIQPNGLKVETIVITTAANNAKVPRAIASEGSSKNYKFEAPELVLRQGEQVDIRIIDRGQNAIGSYPSLDPGALHHVSHFYFSVNQNEFSILTPEKKEKNGWYHSSWDQEPYEYYNHTYTYYYYTSWVASTVGECNLYFFGWYDPYTVPYVGGKKYLTLPVRVVAAE